MTSRQKEQITWFGEAVKYVVVCLVGLCVYFVNEIKTDVHRLAVEQAEIKVSLAELTHIDRRMGQIEKRIWDLEHPQ